MESKVLITKKSSSNSSNSDAFKQDFGESITELVGIKGSFFLYTLLIICAYIALTIYAISILDGWLPKTIFGVFGIIFAFPGGFLSGIWLTLVLLKCSLRTISQYVFTSYNNILLDEIEQYNYSLECKTFLSSSEILKQYTRDVITPVLAGIICAFIPVVGGFIVGRVEKSITKISNMLALTITKETESLKNKEEQYLATIEIVKKNERQITPKIHNTFLALIMPFSISSLSYISLAILSFFALL